MATAAEILEVQQVAQSAGLSPSVQMVLVILLLVMLVAIPLVMLLKDMRKTGKVSENEGKTSDIQTGLYAHLYEQVSILTTRLDKTHEEYNALVRENADLKSRVAALEGSEQMVERLQKRLDEKDAVILARDTQLNVLFNDLRMRDQKIIELQDRLNILEVRLAKDEERFNRGCKE
jgi:chromosome segregation ATPase